MNRPPGGRAVERYLRAHRAAMPRAFRASLFLGIGLVVLYLALQAILQVTSPTLAGDLLRLFFLTMVAGREPALFAVYQGSHPVPVAWAASIAIVDDLATLFLAAPFAWLVVTRLRRIPAFDGLLRSFEHALNDHRATVDRWGTLALAAFLWLPGWGTGPSMSVAMGVLAGIRTARLLTALAFSCVGVNLFWAISLAGAAEAVPDQGLWEFLPLAIVLILVVLAIVTARRNHHRRFILEYPAAWADVGHARLAAWGFESHGDVVRLDARRLAPQTGLFAADVAHAHWAGELLLLPSMTPDWAGRLATLGVTGIRDLAILPADLLRQALGEPSEPHIGSWIREARSLAERDGTPLAPSR